MEERYDSNLVLEDVPSDEETMPRDLNSSDEDEDTNSDSSKGEFDMVGIFPPVAYVAISET